MKEDLQNYWDKRSDSSEVFRIFEFVYLNLCDEDDNFNAFVNYEYESLSNTHVLICNLNVLVISNYTNENKILTAISHNSGLQYYAGSSIQYQLNDKYKTYIELKQIIQNWWNERGYTRLPRK